MVLSALDHVPEIAGSGGQLAIFLDYDGTLTPIVGRPEEAMLSDSSQITRQSLSSAAATLRIFGVA